jgi:hypothetical protein
MKRSRTKDRSLEIYAVLTTVVAENGYETADVLHAIALMIAYFIKHEATDKRPGPTFDALRSIAEEALKERTHE